MNTPLSFSVLWSAAPGAGRVSVTNGRLGCVGLSGQGRVVVRNAEFEASGPARLEVTINGAVLTPGPGATIVRIDSGLGSFSFFLRDLRVTGTIAVPDAHAAVTNPEDRRSCAAIVAAATAGRRLALHQLAEAPETTWDQARTLGRTMWLPALLGLGRDCRLFQVDIDRLAGSWGWIRPSFAGYPVFPRYPHQPEDARFEYRFVLGRGMGAQFEVSRRLEDGCLPILHGQARDGDIEYTITVLVTLERCQLMDGPVRGTPALFAARLAWCNLSEAEAAAFEASRAAGTPDELEADNLTVLLLRVVARNQADVPRHAFFKTPCLVTKRQWRPAIPERYDPATGFLLVTTDNRAAVASRLDGRPLPLSETSVLLPPDGTAVFDLVVPHSPTTPERVAAMARLDFDERLADARAYWRAKLASAAQLQLPEHHLEERVKAGLLQLDTVTYGRGDEPALSVPAGLYYPPIGSETLPLIMFYDSMGWHDVARRGLQFFLERQREDGFIQVYAHYLIETSGVLFGLAEHYRYTRDDDWVRQIAPRLKKACDYLIAWRRRNQRPELRGRGYGMLDGAVADEKDPTFYFFNSGYACAGLRGAASMLATVDPETARTLAAEADAFQQDIRAELVESMAGSPVVPLLDGTWRSSAPPWASHPGPLILFGAPRTAYTHNAFVTQDSLVGPLWLLYQGVLAANDPLIEVLLHPHHELMTVRNVAFCQQYYSRHDYAHLVRGEVNAFLADYYHSLTSTDPELYSFWEHYCQNEQGPYKTHEQAWFLMQTRWLLYLEQGETLRFLPGIPRAWLTDGETIAFAGMKSYFGAVSLHVASRLGEGQITARLSCSGPRRPRRVEVRLPHPQGRHAKEAVGGRYDQVRETVVIEEFTGEAEVRLEF